MALEEAGKEQAKNVLKYIGSPLMKFIRSIAGKVQSTLDARKKVGKMSVNKLLKQNQNFDKDDTPNMNEELMKSLCKELKKYHLAYAVKPQGINKETNEPEYKILYNKKDAPVILNAIQKVKKDIADGNIPPKPPIPIKSLADMLKRNNKILQKNGLNRTEPVKHKEVGAR